MIKVREYISYYKGHGIYLTDYSYATDIDRDTTLQADTEEDLRHMIDVYVPKRTVMPAVKYIVYAETVHGVMYYVKRWSNCFSVDDALEFSTKEEAEKKAMYMTQNGKYHWKVRGLK